MRLENQLTTMTISWEHRLQRAFTWARSRRSPLADLTKRSEELTRTLIARGQAQGAVRSDLPESLLVSVLMAVGEAGDFWLIDRFGELVMDGDVEATVQMFMRLWRSVLAAPREE